MDTLLRRSLLIISIFGAFMEERPRSHLGSRGVMARNVDCLCGIEVLFVFMEQLFKVHLFILFLYTCFVSLNKILLSKIARVLTSSMLVEHNKSSLVVNFRY